jgi:hypothetical protein
MWGDSLNVGIDLRTGGTDLDWPNVYQVRSRAPAGISSDISPLDQAIAPDGNDYLSSHEYFAKQREADIGAAVYIVSHGYNGTKLVGLSTEWGVGNTLHEAAITRINAAIQTVRATAPTAVFGGIIQMVGTNDGSAGTAASTWGTALSSAISDMRSRIFLNGVSGTTAATKPYIINGLMPEGNTSVAALAIEQKMRQIAASTTACKYYKMPEGIARVDNIHPSAAGMRVVGPGNAALLQDATAPVISVATTYSQFAGQNMLIELTADTYAYWTVSNTTDYEVVGIGDGVSGVNSTRIRYYLRWLSDGTKTAGTYSTTIIATDASGNSSSISRTDTVVAAYGGTVGTVSASSQTLSTGSTTNDLRQRVILPVTLGAGMNIIVLSRNTGGATDVSAVTFNGIIATRDANSGTTTQIYYVPSAAAQSGNLLVTPNTSTITSIGCAITCVTGTVATPTTSVVMQNASRTTPHLTTSQTCPTNGIIAGGGLIPSIGTATSGETELARSTNLFSAYRTTDGSIGATGTNNGFSWLAAAAFAKA